jgi:hypothetical protein
MAAAFSGEDAVNSGKYGVSTDQPKPIILDELRQARKQIELLKNMVRAQPTPDPDYGFLSFRK